jgi:hypothetical protein
VRWTTVCLGDECRGPTHECLSPTQVRHRHMWDTLSVYHVLFLSWGVRGRGCDRLRSGGARFRVHSLAWSISVMVDSWMGSGFSWGGSTAWTLGWRIRGVLIPSETFL